MPVAGGLRFLGLDAGASHTCGVTTDHAAYCWGRNEGANWATETPRTATFTPVAGGLRFASVSAGTSFRCGVTTDGAAWCWGWNRAGSLSPAVGWYPEQRMTPEETVRGYTTWAAWTAFQEENTGVLARGRWADLMVMDVHPFGVGGTAPEGLLSGRTAAPLARSAPGSR